MIATNSIEERRPAYGASEHYLGAKGAEYFKWQSGAGHFGARINCHKFVDVVRPTDTVLDFGCGGGFLLAQLNCRERIGVEINPVARAQAESLGIRTFTSADEVPDQIADVVISDHALEHVPYPIGVLQSLRKKLKPTGILKICVPIDNWRHHRTYDPRDENHHLHTWTTQLLGNTLFEAGFHPESIRARIFAWPGRWTVACYGRLPYPVFRGVCFAYGWATGKGTEIIAVARPVQ